MAAFAGLTLADRSWAQQQELTSACRDAVRAGTSRFAVVAVLSPRMVYSMTEWRRLRDTATHQGFEVVAWRSADVADTEWRLAAEQAGWLEADIGEVLPVPADCAGWVGRPNHFPYTVVVGAGNVVSWPIWGVMPDSDWTETLLSRRDQLAKGEAGGF